MWEMRGRRRRDTAKGKGKSEGWVWVVIGKKDLGWFENVSALE